MNSEIDSSLDTMLAAYEQDVLTAWRNKMTFRGVYSRDYQDLYYRDERGKERKFNLVDELTGKIVGDVGSGGGGLAKTAFLHGIDTEIWSIDPNMGDEVFEREERAQSAEYLSAFSEEERMRAQQVYEMRRVRGFAHKLTGVSNGFFDTLVDSYSAHQYIKRPEIYEVSIQELLQGLQPGGKIIVFGGLCPQTLFTGQLNLPTLDFRERTLRRLGIPYTPLYKKFATGERGPVGAIIQKPL